MNQHASRPSILSRVRVFIAAAAWAVSASCVGDPPVAPVGHATSRQSLRIVPDSAWITLGDRAAFGAVLFDSLDRTVVDAHITWTSHDTTVLRVDTLGFVSTVAAGTTTVTASAGGLSQTAFVRVHNYVLSVGSVYAWPDTNLLLPSMTRLIQLRVIRASQVPQVLTNVTWSSSDTAVAVVDSSGVVTARSDGHAVITGVSDGTRRQTDVFVTRFSAPLRFSSVSVDDAAICGLTVQSTVYCWGVNNVGNLGTGQLMDRCEFSSPFTGNTGQTTVDRYVFTCSSVPLRVSFPEPIARLSAPCAIGASGRAYCWGDNLEGQLGIGVPSGTSYKPVPLAGGIRFQDIHPGVHACGVDIDGIGYCWGLDQHGWLGFDPNARPPVSAPNFLATVPSPAPVAGGLRWKTIRPGTTSTCGIAVDGAAYCWGDNLHGVLGVGDNPRVEVGCTNCSVVPARVASGAVPFTQLATATGYFFTCALSVDSQPYCWGVARANGALTDTNQPNAIASPPLTFIESGGRHTCGLSAAGEVYCWGFDLSGLGASIDASLTPVRAGPSFPLQAAGFGSGRACGIRLDGRIYCWGQVPWNYIPGDEPPEGTPSARPHRAGATRS